MSGMKSFWWFFVFSFFGNFHYFVLFLTLKDQKVGFIVYAHFGMYIIWTFPSQCLKRLLMYSEIDFAS